MPSAEATAVTEGLCPAARELLVGSSVLEDISRLRDLSVMSAIDQEYSLRRHISLGIPWPDALPSSEEAVSDLAEEETSGGTSAPGAIQRRRVDTMRPNQHNAALFPDSLSPASIAIMAEDLREHGQEQPLQITPDGVIINGERRWRAAGELRWTEVDVVLTPLGDDEIFDRILSICAASRQMSLREKTNVYAALLARLKTAHGRRQGRPSGKTIPSGNVFQGPKAMKQAAAARAKFESTTEAERALAVFTRGNADLQCKVTSGEMTLTAAYNELSKRPKAQKGLAGNETAESSEEIDVPAIDVAADRAAEGENVSAPSGEVEKRKVAPSKAKGEIDRGPGGLGTDKVVGTARPTAANLKYAPADEDDMSLDGIVGTLPQEQQALAEPTTSTGPHLQQALATRANGPAAGLPLRKPASTSRAPSRAEPNEASVMDNPFDAPTVAAQRLPSEPAEAGAFDRALDTIEVHVGLLCQVDHDQAVKARDLVVARLDATLAKWAPTIDTPAGQSGAIPDPKPYDDGAAEPEIADDSSDDDFELEPGDDPEDGDMETGHDAEDDDTEADDDSDVAEPVQVDFDSDGEGPVDDLDAEADLILGIKPRR